MTAHLQNQIDEMPKYKEIAERAIKEKINIQKELDKTRLQLEEAQNINMFKSNDPYPVGLGEIRIGDSIDKLYSVYKKENIKVNNDPGFCSVENEHSIFRITYYFDDDLKDKKICQIMFMFYKKKFQPDFLQNKLQENFGKPKTYKINGQYSWNLGKVSIYKNNIDSYVILDNTYKPNWAIKYEIQNH